MKKDVIESDKGGEKFDFIEYQYAQQVIKDFPKLMHVYEKLIPVLHQYKHYTAAWEVLQSAEDCLVLLNMQYSYYKRVHDRKGKVDESR